MTWEQIQYFKREEFDCKCGCGFNMIDIRLVSILDNIREILNSPMIITSGCRCPKWNRRVGGVPDSAHLTGLAADISACNSRVRHRLLTLAHNKVRRIGIYPMAVHLDIDQSKPQGITWVGHNNGEREEEKDG